MDNNDSIPWVEKYRPKVFSDIVLNDNNKALVGIFVNLFIKLSWFNKVNVDVHNPIKTNPKINFLFFKKFF